MEDRKVNIIAGSSITALLILIVGARIWLKHSKPFFLVLGVDISLILAVICFLLIRSRYNSRRKQLETKLVSEGRELRIEYSFLRKVAGVPTRFKYKDLEQATDGFRSVIGKGSSGSVFKGTLTDRTQVAVKRIEGEERGEKEFKSEVAAIAGVQHKNLVRLLGYCVPSSSGHKFLVYDFIPNCSLDNWIFPGRKNKFLHRSDGCLSWESRYSVAVDVAKALEYLHHDCRSKILHLDIKPENILLDENFRAIVTDFGFAKLMAKDESRVLTNIRGTRGYLAPEWLLEGGISEKTDVYSYGMVLLEMFGGRKNIIRVKSSSSSSNPNETSKKKKMEYFPRIVNEKMREGKIMEVVDQRLLESGGLDERQVIRFVYIALWCVQERPRVRPTMANVVEMLEGRVPVKEPPDSDLNAVSFLTADDDLREGNNGTGDFQIAPLEIRRDRYFRRPSICSCSVSTLSPR